jgi:hypothetical protein
VEAEDILLGLGGEAVYSWSAAHPVNVLSTRRSLEPYVEPFTPLGSQETMSYRPSTNSEISAPTS